MLRSERYAGLFRVDRAAHALEHDRFLAEQIGDELGAVVIVDAEYLQDAGVRQEGAGAALVERAELVNVLQDRPEPDAVAGQDRKSAGWGQSVSGRVELGGRRGKKKKKK